MTLRLDGQTLDIAYEPLKKGEIRLITFEGITSASPGNRLGYHIRHVSIDDPPPYCALSYRWGNGKELKYPTKFKGNWLDIRGGPLEAVRAYLSNPSAEDGHLPFWIDQFCIEQSSKDEMTQQVSMMHEIYSKATKTVIYLGTPRGPESEGHFRSAFDYLRTLDGDAMSLDSLEQTVQSTKKLPVGTVAALAAVLAAPWFSRTWVVQEAVLSKNAVVLCGNNIEDMVQLCAAISHFDSMAFLRQLFRDFHVLEHPWQARVQRVRLFYRLKLSYAASQPQPSECLPRDAMKRLLARCRPLEATDPRDKIFALAGICRADDRPVVGYELSEAHVYRDTAVRILQEGHQHHRNTPMGTEEPVSCLWNDLCLLALVNADHVMITSPSWIPDWSLPLTYNDLWFEHEESLSFHASGNKSPGVQFPDHSPRTLVISGKLCSAVSSTGEDSIQTRVFHETDMDECGFSDEWWPVSRGRIEGTVEQGKRLPEWIVRAAEYLRAHTHPSVDHQQREERIATTLCAGASIETASGRGGHVASANKRGQLAQLWKSYQKFAARRLGVEIEKDETDAGSRDENERACVCFLGMVGIACRGRRLFVTMDGHIGLGPGRMTEGDVIGVLYGSHWPFVLRPCGDGFLLVGYCYVDGMMHGEIVERGDIPEKQVRLV
ncbi:het domain-containing protein [Diplodia corticola]|uniref:Het domain-containing protein n=1 Tax=Diplodia corticola TaxID=236234 RepID=A0A1J9RR64_9PEZI|nr:het domain-containing protein [Diplodia corticola]OJD30029.1 het domain-containing protein [Diplodia corticola]